MFKLLAALKQIIKMSVLTVVMLNFPIVQAMRFESNIPDVGQEGQFVITNETERLIGKMMMHKINETGLITEDLVVQEYVEQLGQKLVDAGPTPDFKLHYFSLNSSVLNAFAFFGGNIAVHSGLILMVENENELAGVMAHETAHVTQRHLARMLTNQKKMTPLMVLQLIGAIAVGALGAPDAGMGLATAAMGGQAQQIINFTRDHEYEADRLGIQTLSKAGFDPMALPGVFKKLSTATRYNERPPEYLLTHPVFESRIADAYNRAEKLPYRQSPDSLYFHLVRARIEAASQNKTQSYLDKCKERLHTGRVSNNLIARYAYALALTKARKYDEARIEFNSVLKEIALEPEAWIIELSLAEMEQVANNLEEAISQFDVMYYHYPSHPAIVYQFAKALQDAKQYEKSKQLLLQLKSKQPENLQLYLDLAKVNSKLKKNADVHRAQAEWHFLRGEYPKAEQQLDLAMEKAGHDNRLKDEIRFRKNKLEDWKNKKKELKL